MSYKNEKEWFSNLENKERIPALTGKTIIKVEHEYTNPFCEGWILTFDDGTRLTARDGEYGDDAFRFIKD